MATVEITERDGREWKSPLRKLVRFFPRSRDRWKAKYLAVKDECKLRGNQVRAVEKSRERWKQKAQQAKQQLRQLRQELAEREKSPAA